MSATLLIDIIGWIGAGMLLYAYARVSNGSWSGQSTAFQLLNVGGSLCFIINSGYHGAYPSVFVNVVWAAIGFRVLGKRRGRETTAS
jgi:hypothetical protein